MPRTQERQSFLKHEQAERPASKGWRGGLVRMGLRVPPNASERAERDDLHAVSQHWPGPRTIAVVNGKGGAGKTPTTINLAAVFARHGGAGVLAWDNNQTRGTLGWRTERGPHESTLLEPPADRAPARHQRAVRRPGALRPSPDGRQVRRAALEARGSGQRAANHRAGCLRHPRRGGEVLPAHRDRFGQRRDRPALACR
ncbi:AAA family ATPase [Microbacterium elymi]|uniref:AAA family ATPase n=1 Tax=Microbacterium elymi TaxID=2909587 RepID=A0ABY5NGM0_9MICO|nr:AAA family ATPase [Microbacterium elymi]UUT34317.1 AAA family ATPase [Microbacterium elymi]